MENQVNWLAVLVLAAFNLFLWVIVLLILWDLRLGIELVLERLLTIIEKENLLMALTQAEKDAIAAAIASAQAAITEALAKEKTELVAQIQALIAKLPSSGITADELNSIVTGIQGIGIKAVADIDKLSTEDGADAATGDPGTGGGTDPNAP